MNIVIIGCGKVGRKLAADLSEENHDVTVVDVRPNMVKRLANELDIMAIRGNGIDHETLDDAGVANADLLISVTGNDELNLLCCLLAKRMNPKLQTAARVRNPEYTDYVQDLRRDLSINLIVNPELTAAREIFRSITLPNGVSSEAFSSGSPMIYSFRIQPGSILDNLMIRDIHPKLRNHLLVCFVERDDKAFIPDGDFVLKERDIISVAGDPNILHGFFDHVGIKHNRIKNVMVVGAGRVGFYLARMLENTRMNLTIIESDQAVCEEMAEKIPNATIIYGNGSDQALLHEEGLDEMDAFIALTGIDEENIILSLYARSAAGIKTITKINRIAFDEVINTMDLDTIVNPKQLTAEVIIRYVRALSAGLNSNVETVHKLAHDQVESLEFRIREQEPYTNIPLQDLPVKPGVLVAMIIRKKRLIVPKGYDELKAGDKVIIVTTKKGVCDLSELIDLKELQKRTNAS